MLARNKVRPGTQRQYVAALLRLADWLAMRPLPDWPGPVWDEHLSEFFGMLYDQGEGPHSARVVMAALLWAQPRLGGTMKARFPHSFQSAQGWTRLQPPKSRPPIPWLVAAGMAEWLFQTGKPHTGLLIIVLFQSYCRPSEGLQLLARQVIRPRLPDAGVLSRVSLVLNPSDLGVPSKTGLMDSSVALDLEHHRWVEEALLRVKQALQPEERLFKCSYLELLADMRSAARALGCSVLRPTPHGLRHGGASQDRALGRGALPEIQSRGKWRSPLSVQRYEKHAMISEQLEKLPTHVFLELRSREARLPSVCRASFGP